MLVIIIVVLLVLSGVTIVQLTASGIFRKENLAENIEFSYDKERIVYNKIQILLKIKDIENGLDKIEYPDGDILYCNGKKQIAIDYMIDLEEEYKFKITSNSGEEKEEIIYEKYSDLIEEIYKIQESGYYNLAINGRTLKEDIGEILKCNVHMIVYNGNLTLDGTTNIEGATIGEQVIEEEGATISQKVYEFGDKNTDVAKQVVEEDDTVSVLDASNMIVLKVNGDLTINENVIVTSCKSDDGYGGPKGMFIYCTGTLTNKGTISMTARGARAEGQNVYIFQNSDGSYEYVPAVGADGGKSQVAKGNVTKKGNNGENGIGRQTGGGGSGAARDGDKGGWSVSGAGAAGTSYSGGTGRRRTRFQ